MIIFDSTYLIALLHDNPPPPRDENNIPVARFKERIAELVNTVSAQDTTIGVPTPVIAEILVYYPESKEEYLEVLRNRYKFEILPFGIKAAIEASELIAKLVAETKQPASQWAKVKFDVQIVAIAKGESGVTMLYADDKGIVNNAKRLKIPVMRICELPLPPERKPTPPLVTDATGQTRLFTAETEQEDGEEREREPKAPEKAVAESGELQGCSDGSVGNPAEGKEGGEAKAEDKPEQSKAAAAISPIAPDTPKPTTKGGLGEDGS